MRARDQLPRIDRPPPAPRPIRPPAPESRSGDARVVRRPRSVHDPGMGDVSGRRGRYRLRAPRPARDAATAPAGVPCRSGGQRLPREREWITMEPTPSPDNDRSERGPAGFRPSDPHAGDAGTPAESAEVTDTRPGETEILALGGRR